MKIVFTELPTSGGKIQVSFDGGITFKDYNVAEIKVSGIPLDDNQDYEKIQIKGSSNILKSLDVISKINTHSDDDLLPEDVTGIVLKDFKVRFDKSLLQKYPKLTSVTIPEGVTSISYAAFENCSSLTSITIPDSVTAIGGNAFRGCTSLTSINIPDSITSIDAFVFYNCSSLTDVTIPNNVTSIGYTAFAGCSSLISINIPNNVTSIGASAFANCKKLTSITIPNSVTSISSHAFYNCSNLTNITIPASVTLIDDNTCHSCSKLKTINYKGTEEQWNAISKGNNWNKNCPSDMVINYNYQG